MTLNDYQDLAMMTRTESTYGDQVIVYPTLGLSGESGEVADKVKKVLRDNNGDFTDDRKHHIALELGDVMWYASALAIDLGYTLEDICQMNLDKLSSRMKRNKIHGEGDERLAMNCNMVNLPKGSKVTDGVNILKYWGKMMSTSHEKKMIYVFFDTGNKCHELSIRQVIKLKPIQNK